MSTLEKIIRLLPNLSEKQLDFVYSLVLFLDSKKENIANKEAETLEDILESITGVLQDSRKTLAEYQNEKIKERYEIFN